MTEILKTQNKTWGFWGTASNHIEHKQEMQAFWDKAAEIIQSKGLTPQQTLGLMDSRWGRHIADEFAEELSTNLETFASVFKRQMSTIRLIKEFRYYVDPKAFPDVSERGWQELEAAIPKEPNQKIKVKKQPKFIQIKPTKVNDPWL